MENSRPGKASQRRWKGQPRHRPTLISRRKKYRLNEIRELIEVIPGLTNCHHPTELTVIEETIKYITQLENEVIQRYCGHTDGTNFDRSRPQLHPLLQTLLPRRSWPPVKPTLSAQSAENSPCRTSDEEH